jgi:hypothetical protein
MPSLAASIAKAFLRERDAIRSLRPVMEREVSSSRSEMPVIMRSYH